MKSAVVGKNAYDGHGHSVIAVIGPSKLEPVFDHESGKTPEITCVAGYQDKVVRDGYRRYLGVDKRHFQ